MEPDKLEVMAKAGYEKWDSIYELGEKWESLMECDREHWRNIIRAILGIE